MCRCVFCELPELTCSNVCNSEAQTRCAVANGEEARSRRQLMELQSAVAGCSAWHLPHCNDDVPCSVFAAVMGCACVVLRVIVVCRGN
jgi:hypothetical protein